MSSFNDPKNPSVVKYRSKIPTSSQKSETKVSVPAIPNEQFNRLTNARSRSASNTNLPTTKSRVTTNPANSLKRMFEKKCSLLKKHSHDVKEGFLSKQKELERVYREVTELREKMIEAGSEEVEDIGDVLYTLIPTRGTRRRNNVTNIDLESAEKFIASLKPKLEEMPNTLLDMCRATLVKRSELTQQLSEILTHPKDKELLSKLETLKDNNEESLALESMQANYKVLISTVVAELNKFLTDIKSYHSMISENLTEDLTDKLTATITELNTVRAKNSGLAEKKSMLEKQMADMKLKIKKLEDQLAEKETRLTHQRQKESNLDQGIKDLKNSMEKTKEALEIRIRELKKDNDLKEKELEDYKKETEGRVKEFMKELDEEIVKRKDTEVRLAELQQRYAKLEEKSMNLYDMTVDLKSMKKGKDADLTENELVLYEKLKYAQEKIDTLQSQLSELQNAKEQLTKIFESQTESEHVDLESQLMLQIANNNLLNNKYEKLRQNFDKMSEENHLLEKQLLEVKSRLLMKADEVETDKLNLEIAQLKQQTNDLKSALAETRDRNIQLEKSLTKGQLSLDSKDRELKKMQQILQQRFEVFQVLKPEAFSGSEVNLLKGNNDDQSKLINEYIESLSEKQKKIETMKKTINRLMDQEHRAQKSRTNLEHRIAQLEEENLELKNEKPRSRILGIF